MKYRFLPVSLHGGIDDFDLLKTQRAGEITVFAPHHLNGNVVQLWWYQRLQRTKFETHP
jgi:hypothetical protein